MDGALARRHSSIGAGWHGRKSDLTPFHRYSLMDAKTPSARRTCRARIPFHPDASNTHPTCAGISCPTRIGGRSGWRTPRHGHPHARIQPRPCAAASRSLLLHGSAMYGSQVRASLCERKRAPGSEYGTWICQWKEGGPFDDRVGGIRLFFDRIYVGLTMLSFSATALHESVRVV